MADKILILGSRGYLGQRLAEAFKADSSSRHIYTLADAQEEIEKFSPRIIINCIGYIGRNVDDCELDKDKTLVANAFIPLILAEAALRNQIKLVHISSGCIYQFDYDKDKPIDEYKTPDYFNLFYSRSKIYSEAPLDILSRQYPILIARLRVPLDNRPHPKNLLDKLIRYKNIINLPNSVTYIPDFIRALEHLMQIDARGIYNIVNKGALYYPDLMDIYRKYVPPFRYEIVDYKALNMVRTNLILSTEKLEKTGFKVRPIQEVLEECVRDYLKYL